MTETQAAAPPESRVPREITVGQLAWFGLGAVFVLMRLAGALSIPVGGVELSSLSGAWQAHAGNDDSRFVPTLFQAITAWSFSLTTSEEFARVLALIASASVPFALHRLRGVLGEAAALSALALLAFDPVSLLLGSTAWAGALDVPLALWLLVLLWEPSKPRWLLAVAGFLAATAGSIALPFVLAVAAVRLFHQRYPGRDDLIWAAGGVAVGWILAAVGFGFGFRDPVLPPLMTFAQGFESSWSSESTRYLAFVYSGPLLALALAAAVYRGFECWREEYWSEQDLVLVSSFALSLAWVVVAGGARDPVPLGAAGLAAAFVLGREIPGLIATLRAVPWLYAGPVLAGLVFAALIVEAYLVDWARVDRVGGDRDKLIVAGLSVACLAAAGLLASNRRTAPALLAIGPILAFVPMFSGAFGVAFGGPNEPLPSPVSGVQGREIRDIAVTKRSESGGLIVIHADFEDEMTWAFRDSGEVVLASRVPPDASVVVWPTTEPAPEGFAVLDGNWSLVEDRFGPSGGFLDYLRWLTNRNSLRTRILPVAVYLRTTP